ncbi:MAG: hypothetical protein ABUS47_08765 [Steroidobacter sp.]
MTNARSKTHLGKWLLLSSLGLGLLIAAICASALSIFVDNNTTFDGISCDDLSKVYKRAYTAAGFKFKNREARQPALFLLSFDFPNPAQPNKLPGGGALKFRSPDGKDETSCNASEYYMGVGANWGIYSSEEYEAFEKAIFAARDKAEVLVRKKLGNRVSISVTKSG